MQWNLIMLRKENNETQQNLAELLNLSTTSYREKETGKTQFKGDEMFIIAEHYGKKIEQIFLPSKFSFRELKETD